MKPVLIDTSAWVQYFREKESREGDIIAELVNDDAILTTGIVVAELIAGTRKNNEKTILKKILAEIPFLQVTEQIWWQTGEYRNKMKQTGFTTGLPDTIIAAVAIHYNATLFTLDTHFTRIAELIPLKLYKL